MIEQAITDDDLKADPRVIASTMVGAMMLARAVDDPVLSEAFLESGRRAILANASPEKQQKAARIARRPKPA